MPDLERSLVVYQGSPIERVGTRALVFPEGHQKESRFFIPDDIVVSQYGVIGFLAIDKTPEQRWVSYTSYDWTGVEVRDYDISWRSGNPTHFENTDQGFKMIRYFILPPTVGDFFARDPFLGEPLIDKCCRGGTLPEEFDEDIAYPNIAFGSVGGVISASKEELIGPVIRAALPELTGEELDRYDWGKNQYAYVSFHPWQDFKYVVSTGMESLFAAMANFDGVIAKFDDKRVLTTRVLSIENPNTLSLESSQE